MSIIERNSKKVGITDKESFSLEKFEKLSCLTKKELIDDPNLILSVPEDKIVQVFLSTGTTSDSVYMLNIHGRIFIFMIWHQKCRFYFLFRIKTLQQ